MSKLKAAFKWLLRHWYIPFFALGVVLGAVLFRPRESPKVIKEKLSRETEVIEAKKHVKLLEAKLGHQWAASRVEEKYRKELESLNEKQKQKAERLRSDPVALSAFLIRAGKR